MAVNTDIVPRGIIQVGATVLKVWLTHVGNWAHKARTSSIIQLLINDADTAAGGGSSILHRDNPPEHSSWDKGYRQLTLKLDLYFSLLI
jgi:hypothetical protein